MTSITPVFISAILPVIGIILIGFLLHKVQKVDVEPLNTVSLFVLTPALVFHSIVITELETSALLKVSLGVILFLAIIILVSVVLGRGVGKNDSLLGAFVLVAVFGNTGGLGIPLADFAFGEVGRQTAVLFAAVHGAVVFTIGMFIASQSAGGTNRSSFRRVFRYPLIYAVGVAVLVRAIDIAPSADSVPMETIGLVGESAIPVMLIILGIQLAQTEYRNALSMTTTPILFRFCVSPVIGLAVVLLLGFQHSTVARVFVLLTAMPVAIGPVIFVVEFANDTRIAGVTLPEYVSTAVLVTTILSIPILTGLIILLQSGTLF